VIGVNAAINSPSGGSVGIGFAVPSEVVGRVVPVLIESGQYPHPDLGLSVVELGTEITPGADSPVQQGLLVTQVNPGSGANQAGLQAANVTQQRGRYYFSGGDTIIAADGQPMTSRSDLEIYVDEHYRPGDTVVLTIVRDSEQQDVSVTLGTR
jgi:S1-C subfamily serine protease